MFVFGAGVTATQLMFIMLGKRHVVIVKFIQNHQVKKFIIKQMLRLLLKTSRISGCYASPTQRRESLFGFKDDKV